jgi:hypothetical protein
LLWPELKVGKISAGYNADLVILNANPLDNIENTKQINFVLNKGKVAQKNSFKLSPLPVAIDFDSKVFEFNSLVKLPSYISIYTDASMGGASTATLQLEKDANTNSIHLTGNMVKKGYVGFVGAYINLSKTEEDRPVNLEPFKYVEFDVKGNAENYDAVLGSLLIKDYNYHKAKFTPTKEWKTIKISFEDFKQNPWYGKKVKLDLQTISALNFETSEKSCAVDIQIKNIHFVK